MTIECVSAALLLTVLTQVLWVTCVFINQSFTSLLVEVKTHLNSPFCLNSLLDPVVWPGQSLRNRWLGDFAKPPKGKPGQNLWRPLVHWGSHRGLPFYSCHPDRGELLRVSAQNERLKTIWCTLLSKIIPNWLLFIWFIFLCVLLPICTNSFLLLLFHRFSPTQGLVCRQEDQSSKTCLDYKVRFGCPCTKWTFTSSWWKGQKKRGNFMLSINLFNASTLFFLNPSFTFQSNQVWPFHCFF